MAVATQNNFTGGEFSPRLYARDDVPRYATAVAKMLNMLAYPQGGCTRRPGTQHVNPTKDDGEARLIPFTFGREDAYVLEFGNLYVRVYRARGVVTLGEAIYEFASPYAIEQVRDLSWTQTADTMYLVHPALTGRRLTRASNTNWTFTNVGAIPRVVR